MMFGMMKQRLYGWACAAAVVLMSPVMAMARKYEEEKEVIDARLEGYKEGVSLPASGTALMWLLLIFLTVVTVAVMFKDAKRSHLD
jgi:hypothetical protein